MNFELLFPLFEKPFITFLFMLINCSLLSLPLSKVPPVIAFHMGTVGFMTNARAENFKEEISRVMAGFFFFCLSLPNFPVFIFNLFRNFLTTKIEILFVLRDKD